MVQTINFSEAQQLLIAPAVREWQGSFKD